MNHYVQLPDGACVYACDKETIPRYPERHHPDSYKVERRHRTREVTLVTTPGLVDTLDLWTTRTLHGDTAVLVDSDMESVKYPASMPHAEYQARIAALDIDSIDGEAEYNRLSALYTTETTVEKVPCPVDVTGWPKVPFEWTDPPPIPDGLVWQPDHVAMELWGGSAADHLLPGALWGIQGKIIDVYMADPRRNPNRFGIEQRPRVEHGKVRLGYRVWWDPARHKTGKQGVGRKAKQMPVETFTTWEWDGQLPADGLAGRDLAHALERYETLIAEWTARIAPPEGRRCGHCDGHGYILDRKEQP